MRCMSDQKICSLSQFQKMCNKLECFATSPTAVKQGNILWSLQGDQVPPLKKLIIPFLMVHMETLCKVLYLVNVALREEQFKITLPLVKKWRPNVPRGSINEYIRDNKCLRGVEARHSLSKEVRSLLNVGSEEEM